MVFVAYRILTPPNNNLSIIEAPDGSMEARLKEVRYYADQPSYRIDYRQTGKPAWLRIYYLPAYTNLPPENAEPAIAWTTDSRRLDFLMNGTSIWHRVFTDVK